MGQSTNPPRFRAYNALNWVLETWTPGGRGPKGQKGRDRYTIRGYFPSLEHAALRAPNILSRDELVGLEPSPAELLEAVRRAGETAAAAARAAAPTEGFCSAAIGEDLPEEGSEPLQDETPPTGRSERPEGRGL